MGSIDDISQLCRLCLVKDQVNIPIFDETSDIGQIFLKIESCLPVKVSRDDNLPKKICDGCSYKLDMLYTFRSTSVDSEKQLISWLNQAGLSTISQVVKDPLASTTKPEITVKQETFDASDVRVDGDGSEMDAQAYMMQQEQLSYEQEFDFGEASGSTATDMTDEPAPKRARRAAALKKAPIDDETEDDLDVAMQITKAEEEDSDDIDHPDYVEAPSTSTDDQPGPSGVGKAANEAPCDHDYARSPKVRRPRFIVTEQDYTVARKYDRKRGLYTCTHCKKQCDGYFSLLRHCKQFHPFSGHQCNFCNKSFKRRSLLLYHVEIHDQKDKYQCNICKQPLKSKYQLSSHRFLHSIEGRKCPDCDLIYNFRSIAAYYSHRDLHSTEEYLCTECGQSFKGKDRFRGHRNRHHRNIPYNCKECDKVFKTSEGLAQHCRSIHLQARHICDICGKGLCSIQSLKNHMRVHSGERPFICSVCGVQLATSQVLKNHMMLHTNEKPYDCEDCHQVFRTASLLTLHRKRIHTDERPFQCSYCDKRWAISSHLRRHERKVHHVLSNTVVTKQ